jgi:hypothetical protein
MERPTDGTPAAVSAAAEALVMGLDRVANLTFALHGWVNRHRCVADPLSLVFYMLYLLCCLHLEVIFREACKTSCQVRWSQNGPDCLLVLPPCFGLHDPQYKSR